VSRRCGGGGHKDGGMVAPTSVGSLLFGVAFAFVASALYCVGLALQAADARAVSALHFLRISLIRRLLFRPRWIIGSALSVLGWPLEVGALLGKDDSEPEATPNVNPRQAVTTSASGACTGSLLADTHGQTAHQVPLEQQIDDHRRKRADERSGHQERYVEQVLRRDRC